MEETGPITIEIVEQIRSNPDEGLDAFVQHYGARLLIFVRYKLGDKLGDKLKTKVDAEDVLQDFFASLVENGDRFLRGVVDRGVHRAAFRLLENRIKDLYEHHFKTKKRDSSREVREQAAPDKSGGFQLAQIPGATASFSQRIEAQDEYNSLTRIFDGLKDDSRRLFILKFVESCTNQDIADEIGVSISTVKRDTQKLLQTIHRMRRHGA